jgi:putative SOS response-associated peptidase YedK
MCGRYVLDSDTPTIVARFQATTPADLAVKRNFNVAPGYTMPVIMNGGFLEMVRWGFKPPWGDKPVINARYETLDEKPYFKHAHRCIIPATGFYEWKRDGKNKVPYYFSIPDKDLFAFAGICNDEGYAIVTTAATGEMAPIHSRMPVILNAGAEDAWMEGGPALMVSALTLKEVSSQVNSPRNNSPKLIT